MWALLETDQPTGKVIAVFPPDTPHDAMMQEADGRTLIPVTLENSPGWVYGTWDGTRFHPPKEMGQ